GLPHITIAIGEKNKQQKADKEGDRLVQKCGVKASFDGERKMFHQPIFGVDEDTPRQIGGRAIQLLVDKVGPATDGLGQQQGGASYVGVMPGGQIAPTEVEPTNHSRADESAQNIDPASPNIKNFADGFILTAVENI